MGFENKIASREIQQWLYENGKTLATAESCTGGRIAEAIIAVPGASKYFLGGIIAYADEVKKNVLGVSPETLAEHTAFSEETAIEMVAGACRVLGADYAIASTGVAGPGGSTPEAPVGTIWIACGAPGNIQTCKLEEDFGRDINLAIATSKALRMFIDFLKNT